MAKDKDGWLKYTSDAELRLVSGIIFDIQRLPGSWNSIKYKQALSGINQKIFLKSDEDGSEFVLDVTYIPVDFSLGHKIMALIDNSNDIYFFKNLNLDKDYRSAVSFSDVKWSENESQERSDYKWTWPFFWIGVVLSYFYSNNKGVLQFIGPSLMVVSMIGGWRKSELINEQNVKYYAARINNLVNSFKD